MPVYERQVDAYDDMGIADMIEIDQPGKPGIDQVVDSVWQTSATKGLWDWISEPEFPEDPSFNPDWKTLEPEYQHIYSELAEAKSLEEFRSIQRREDSNRDHYDVIARSGLEGITYSLAAGMLDPITLPLWFIPVTKGFQAAGTVGKMGRLTGFASADMAARESIMHHALPSRTADETTRAMLLTASGATAIGALAGRSSIRVPSKARKKVVDEAKWNANATQDAAVTEKSIGAAEVGEIRRSSIEYSVKDEMPAKGQKWFYNISVKSPNTRSAMAPFDGLAAPAATISQLVYTGVMKNKYLRGVSDWYSTPVDSMVRNARNVAEMEAMDAIRLARREISDTHGVKLSHNEIATMMERGVVYGNDAIRYPQLRPYIQAERKYRADLLDRMKRAGMLSDDVTIEKFNKHYGPRLYDNDAVRNNPKGWVKGVTSGYKARGDARTDDELFQRAIDAQRNVASLSKTGEASSFGRGGGQSARLKSISLKIDDDYIEPFLIRDVRKARDALNRQLLPELILRERYGNVLRTDDGLKVPALTEGYKKEFDPKYQALIKEGKNEEAKRLLKVHEQNLKDLDHVLKKIGGFGEYNTILTPKVAGFLNELRAYAGAAWLGNSMIASLHEPLRVAMEHGFTPMLRANRLTAFPIEKTRQYVEQMRAFGTGVELRTHGSTAVLRADIDSPPMLPAGAGSIAQRQLAPTMYKWNGQNWFNQTFKTGAATTHGDQMVRYAAGTQGAKKGSVEYTQTEARFAQLGIGKTEMKQLSKAIDDGFVEEINGVYFIDLEGMTNKSLARKLGESMAMYADSVVVTPGTGALPMILDNQVGKMLTQFRNVFFNMQSKTIMPTASRIAHGDMRALRGMSAMMAMSWLIYQFRLYGRAGFDSEAFEEEWGKMSIQDHVREMIEASGMSGLTMEMFSMADSAVEGNLSRTFGMQEGARSRMGLATLVPPGLSWAKRVSGAALSPLTEDGTTQADINAAGYAVPLRTMWYLDPLLDQIQESTANQFPQGGRDTKVVRY